MPYRMEHIQIQTVVASEHCHVDHVHNCLECSRVPRHTLADNVVYAFYDDRIWVRDNWVYWSHPHVEESIWISRLLASGHLYYWRTRLLLSCNLHHFISNVLLPQTQENRERLY